MKEIIEILKMIRSECYNDNDMDLSLDRIDVLAISALDKLKAQEEAERYCVKVVIPELINGQCNLNCPSCWPVGFKGYVCVLRLMTGPGYIPGEGCPRYQK